MLCYQVQQHDVESLGASGNVNRFVNFVQTYRIGVKAAHCVLFGSRHKTQTLMVTICTFQWRFAAILVNCAPSGEMHNYCTPHIIKENFENFLIHRCNYVLISQVYCV